MRGGKFLARVRWVAVAGKTSREFRMGMGLPYEQQGNGRKATLFGNTLASKSPGSSCCVALCDSNPPHLQSK
eukprot:m.243992 g.243992  ORF g.243992 m.243992 type:complete len:72 (+) comp19030_c0_seq8:1369-1584(+)